MSNIVLENLHYPSVLSADGSDDGPYLDVDRPAFALVGQSRGQLGGPGEACRGDGDLVLQTLFLADRVVIEALEFGDLGLDGGQPVLFLLQSGHDGGQLGLGRLQPAESRGAVR